MEAQSAVAQKQFSNLVETATQNAPAGSEQAVAMMKGAVTAANTAYESVQKAVKQATDMAESNIAAVTQSVTAAAPKVAKKK
jgi:cell division ATPase FtsA